MIPLVRRATLLLAAALGLTAACGTSSDVVDASRTIDGASLSDGGEKVDGRSPSDSGEREDGRSRSDGGKKEDGRSPSDGGKKVDGRSPSDGGKKEDGRSPSDSGKKVDGRSPSDGGKKVDGRSPSDGGRKVDGGLRRDADALDGGGGSVAAQWGTVNEPTLPTSVCATLAAALIPVDGSIDGVDGDPSSSQVDTSRIQSAISACPAGQAVKLEKGAAGESGFLTGPLTLASGVTLWIDTGVTLFASRSPADYETSVGTCGTATVSNADGCEPLILALNTAASGIVGGGTIDGRGGSVLTSGPNAGSKTWWDVSYERELDGGRGLNPQSPDLIEVNGSDAFTLYGLEIENAPFLHVLTNDVSGMTAWGIRILAPSREYAKPGYACPPGTLPGTTPPGSPATCFTPGTVKNTAGFLPTDSSQVLLAYSYISDGDDMVAVNAHGSPSSYQLAFLHNHFYYGHGMSIGSETDSGLTDVLVSDLTIDGYDDPESIGLRIKSDANAGGTVNGVTYEQICMRNVVSPLVFDAYYSPASGTLYPDFENILVRGLHDVGSTLDAGGRPQLTFAGYDIDGHDFPLTLTLDNVVFDGNQPSFPSSFSSGYDGGPTALPAATHFTLGPGEVSFGSLLIPSAATDVTVVGTPGTSTPVDCGPAAFVPYSNVVTDSPI